MSKISLEEYKSKIKWSKGKRDFKVTNSYNTMDYLKYYRELYKDRPDKKLTYEQFFAIIQLMGKKLADEYLRSGEIYFPYNMGFITLYKIDKTPKIKDGKLQVTKPIDWNSTLELWYEDEEAEREKILVRYNERQTFRTKYSNFGTRHKNKSFFDFKIVRALQKRIKELSTNNELEAFKAF